MRAFRTSIALLLLLSSAGSLAQVSPVEFTGKFISAVAKTDPDVVMTVNEPLHLTATDPSGNEVVAFLDNAYELYEQDVDQLDEILARYAESLLETLTREVEPLQPSNIVPVVKDSGWLAEAIGAAFKGREAEAPEYFHTAFVDGLSIIYAEDTPANIRYVEKATIDEVGIDIEAIPALAVVNLLTKLPEISIEGGDGLYMIIADGTYEASLLLVDEIWSGENFSISGDIVVAVPARDVLLVSGSRNAEQLEQLIAIAAQVYSESPYYLTRNLYVRRDNGWQIFDK